MKTISVNQQAQIVGGGAFWSSVVQKIKQTFDPKYLRPITAKEAVMRAMAMGH